MATKAQNEANKRYNDKNCVWKSVKLNKNTDDDILSWLEKQKNKNDAIKSSIRLKMKTEKDG